MTDLDLTAPPAPAPPRPVPARPPVRHPAAAPAPAAPPTWAVAGCLAALGLLSMLYVLPRRPSNFLMTFWALSYDRGYRARALPASVLQWLGVDHVSIRLVTWVSSVLLLSLLALLVLLAVRAHRARPGWPALVLGVLLVGSPATLRSIAFELATLDNLVLVLTLGALALLGRGAGPARVVAVSVLATLTVLVHEAAVLLTLPLVVAAVVVAAGDRPWRVLAAHVALVVAGPAVALAWVTSAPVVPAREVPARLAVVREVAEVDRDDTSASWAIRNHTRDLAADVRHTAEQVRERGHGRHALALAACVPSVVAAAALGAHLVRGRSRRLLAVLGIGVAVAPLVLAPLGHDWGRWIAYGTMNAVVWATWLAGRRRRQAGAAPAAPSPLVLLVTAALVAASLMTPPLARAGSFRVRVGQPAEIVKVLLGW